LKLLENTISCGCAAKYPSDKLLNILEFNGDNNNHSYDYEDAFIHEVNVEDNYVTLAQSVDVIAPIVNNPYKYGAIAATHALSDLYAVNAKPISAMNICCFPDNDNFISIGKEILKGAFDKLREANCILAGGHTVTDNNNNIKYGLSVTGSIESYTPILRKSGLKINEFLILTKPLGIGTLVTALKLDIDTINNEDRIYEVCSKLNNINDIITEFYLTGGTDVTGFGLGGSLVECCKASNCSVKITHVPLMKEAINYYNTGIICNRAIENYKVYKDLTTFESPEKNIYTYGLFEPQTSGGLLLSVDEDIVDDILVKLKNKGFDSYIIGRVIEKDSKLIYK